jgi:hypothetical protein
MSVTVCGKIFRERLKRVYSRCGYSGRRRLQAGIRSFKISMGYWSGSAPHTAPKRLMIPNRVDLDPQIKRIES